MSVRTERRVWPAQDQRHHRIIGKIKKVYANFTVPVFYHKPDQKVRFRAYSDAIPIRKKLRYNVTRTDRMLPLRHGVIARLRRAAIARKHSGDKGVMKRILLAEDDENLRRFLAKALARAGYDVVSYDNGLSAYNRLREEPFTLLLTDIVMPEMDGIELARKATELDPDIKVMFITGFAAVALNPQTVTPRDSKVLSKPFHLRDLVRQVERMLAA